MEQSSAAKHRYITGLDGLRAIAVVGVILFHLWPQKMVGGWLGVPLFFVISGYLITDLLIQEYDQTQTINLRSFWWRRIKRLYPALLGMLLLVTTLIGLFTRDFLYNLRGIIATNLTYVFNFWEMGHGQSYFNQWNNPSPFTHLWSLSIEGQFYLVWPLIVWWVLKQEWNRTKIAGSLVGASVISAVLMITLYNMVGLNRAYYGTDTRLFSILLGTALAFVWPSLHLREQIKPRVRRILNLTGWGAMLLMLVAFLMMDGQLAWPYDGGMYLVSLVMTILVAVTVHPASQFSQLLNGRVWNYLGTRSYSIYLYQLPVFVLYDQLVHRPVNLFDGFLKIAWVLLLAEVSYRYIEEVFRRKANFTHQMVGRTRLVYQIIVGTLSLGMLFALVQTNAGKAQPKTDLEQRLTTNAHKIQKANQQAQAEVATTDQLTDDDRATMDQFAVNEQQYQQLKTLKVTAVGDSVLLNTAPNLQELVPHMQVDAKVGRSVADIVSIVQQTRHKDQMAGDLLIAAGTNGNISEKQVQMVMQAAGPKVQVYWVNDFANRSWIAGNNLLLNQMNKKYDNLHIVNWQHQAQQHPEWLGKDGVHPNPVGSVEYTKLILRSVLKTGKD